MGLLLLLRKRKRGSARALPLPGAVRRRAYQAV
jgi:hypothetical protein